MAKRIHMGGLEKGMPVTLEISVPLIIGENEKNVGWSCRFLCPDADHSKSKNDGVKKEQFFVHKFFAWKVVCLSMPVWAACTCLIGAVCICASCIGGVQVFNIFMSHRYWQLKDSWSGQCVGNVNPFFDKYCARANHCSADPGRVHVIRILYWWPLHTLFASMVLYLPCSCG